MGYNFIGQARLAWLNSVLMMIALLAAPIAACLINLMNRKGRRRCHRCHMQLQLATASAIDSNNIAITAAQSKLWTGSNCRSYRSIYAQLNAAIFLFTPSLLLFPPDWQTDIGFGLRWLHCASSTQFTLWFQSIESSTSTRLTSHLLSLLLSHSLSLVSSIVRACRLFINKY